MADLLGAPLTVVEPAIASVGAVRNLDEEGTTALTVAYREKVGSLADPEAPSASWTSSARNAAIAFMVN